MPGVAHERTKAYAKFSTRDAILKAAEDVCAEQGSEQVKIRELARIVGIKPASIYNHFEGRDDVLAEVVRAALIDLIPRLERALTEEPAVAVETICRAYAELFCDRPGIARLVLADFAEVRGVPSFEANKALLRQVNDLEKQVYMLGYEQRVFRKVRLPDAIMARMGMTLMMLSARWLSNEAPNKSTAKTIGRTATEFMLRYLRD